MSVTDGTGRLRVLLNLSCCKIYQNCCLYVRIRATQSGEVVANNSHQLFPVCYLKIKQFSKRMVFSLENLSF